MMLRSVVLLCAVGILSFRTAVGADDPLEPSAQMMRQYGMSYKQAVREARAKKERGLTVLFRLSTSRELDGMRAEIYASDIRALLDIWGDKAFAAVLRKQPASVRRAEWRWLRDIALVEFSHRYPESLAASYP